MRFQFSAKDGFTLIEIMIVVAIIGLLAAIAIPNYLKNRAFAQKKACISNLSQIDSAKQIWGVEHGKSSTDVPTQTDLIGVNLYIKTMPQCPAGGTYTINEIDTYPTCTVSGHVLN